MPNLKILVYLFLLLSFFSCDEKKIDSPLSFEKTYGGTSTDYAVAAIPYNNDIYIFGTSSSFGTQGNLYLLKINSEGRVLMERAYGRGDGDGASNIIKTLDGNLLLSGISKTTAATTHYDIIVIKIQPNGDTLWQTKIGDASFDIAKGLVETEDGGFFLLGPKSNGSTNDFRLIKLDANGKELWQKIYPSSFNDSGQRIVSAGDGNYMLFGQRKDGDDDFLLYKIDGQGNTLWSKTYGGADYEEAHSLIKSQDGHFYLCGHSGSSDALHDLYVVKIDANGVLIWERHIGGDVHDGGVAIVEAPNGDVLVTGETNSYGNRSQRLFFARIDSDGEVLEEKSFGGDLPDKGSAIVYINDVYYLIGESSSFSTNGNGDVYVISK